MRTIRRARRRALALGRITGRAIRRSPRDNLLTARALLEFALAEVAVRVLPVRRAAKTLGVHLDLSAPSGAVAGQDTPPALPTHARRRHEAVLRVARRWPFGHGPCLRESFAACRMLRSWEPTTRLGVRRQAGELAAHAWVEINGQPLRLSEEFLAFGTPRATTSPDATNEGVRPVHGPARANGPDPS